jgi:hypothetical protein
MATCRRVNRGSARRQSGRALHVWWVRSDVLRAQLVRRAFRDVESVAVVAVCGPGDDQNESGRAQVSVRGWGVAQRGTVGTMTALHLQAFAADGHVVSNVPPLWLRSRRDALYWFESLLDDMCTRADSPTHPVRIELREVIEA